MINQRRGRRIDMIKKISYGACDKLALRQLKAIATFLLLGIIYSTP